MKNRLQPEAKAETPLNIFYQLIKLFPQSSMFKEAIRLEPLLEKFEPPWPLRLIASLKTGVFIYALSSSQRKGILMYP